MTENSGLFPSSLKTFSFAVFHSVVSHFSAVLQMLPTHSIATSPHSSFHLLGEFLWISVNQLVCPVTWWGNSPKKTYPNSVCLSVSLPSGLSRQPDRDCRPATWTCSFTFRRSALWEDESCVWTWRPREQRNRSTTGTRHGEYVDTQSPVLLSPSLMWLAAAYDRESYNNSFKKKSLQLWF